MTPIFERTLVVPNVTSKVQPQFYCSLGCGIGYGYLHRIPVRGSPVPPASHNPSRPSAAPTSKLSQQAVVTPVQPTQEGNIVADVPSRPIIAAQETVMLCYVCKC